jgi:2-polyprenyl-3-methyl-5-hydroxy-6-metoxy-1,4-benzoquinol methylase
MINAPRSKPPEKPTLELLLRICQEYNLPHADYLKAHVNRFLMTRSLLLEQWQISCGNRILDIGAHWLHNAACYAISGFDVTASDLAVNNTLSHPAVINLAKDYNITLQPYRDLSDPVELDLLPPDSFDLILFAEIIEHITFNPVKMWSVLYRLLRLGGRIIVTTPNYHVAAFLEDAKNLLRGKSCGIAISTLLETNTFGPHWKEYSATDIREYFEQLSPDFRINRLLFTDPYPTDEDAFGFISRVGREMTDALPGNLELAEKLAAHLTGLEEVRCFKRSLHAEIDLVEKNRGIVVSPHW